MNSAEKRDPADFYDFGPPPPPDLEWEQEVIPEHVRALYGKPRRAHKVKLPAEE